MRAVGVNTIEFTSDSFRLGGQKCLVNRVVSPDFSKNSTPPSLAQCIGMGGHEDIFVLATKSLHIIHFWNPQDQRNQKKWFLRFFVTIRMIGEVKKGFEGFLVS